jgi:hypothetical protein
MMGRIKLQPRVIEALLSAGATEKIIIADAHQILDACITRIGRPRKYKNRAERERAYRERKKARDETRVETSPLPPEAYMTQNSIAMRAHYAARLRDETRVETPTADGGCSICRDERRVARVETRPMVPSLQGLLVDAARHNVDLSAGEEPIRHLIDIGCDLDADILPTVARTVPGLPRPRAMKPAR